MAIICYKMWWIISSEFTNPSRIFNSIKVGDVILYRLPKVTQSWFIHNFSTCVSSRKQFWFHWFQGYCQWIIDVLYYSSSLLMIIGIIEKQILKMKVNPWEKVNELCDFVGWRGDNHPQTGSWLKSKVCLGAEEKDGHHTIPGAEAWLLGGIKVHSAVWDVSSTHVKSLYCMLLSFYAAVFFSGIRESRSCSFFRPLETHALDRYLCCDRNIKLDGDHW